MDGLAPGLNSIRPGPQGKVGGQWRLGHQVRNEEAERERRENIDRKDDRESQKSRAGSRSTVTEESVRVRDRSGGLAARPRLEEDGGNQTCALTFRRIFVLGKNSQSLEYHFGSVGLAHTC